MIRHKLIHHKLIAQLSTTAIWLTVKMIHGYRFLLSPWIGNQCRFYPSCSHYSEQALITHGFLKGFYLTLRRLLKCHPWHEGGLDSVPLAKNNETSPQHSHSTHGCH